MFKFHVFFDTRGRAIVIEDDPRALARAPRASLAACHSHGTADVGQADRLLKRMGGLLVSAEGPILGVRPRPPIGVPH